MTRTLLVYNWFHTCSTTCLFYNSSQDRFRLDGFIDCSFTSGSLLYAWAQGLAPPFYYDYFMHLARGLDVIKALSVPQGIALVLTCWMLYIYSTIPDPRGFLRLILGICLLTIISGMLFRNKDFFQIIIQRTYLVIGSGQKDWFER
jgi:hypothetical protein